MQEGTENLSGAVKRRRLDGDQDLRTEVGDLVNSITAQMNSGLVDTQLLALSRRAVSTYSQIVRGLLPTSSDFKLFSIELLKAQRLHQHLQQAMQVRMHLWDGQKLMCLKAVETDVFANVRITNLSNGIRMSTQHSESRPNAKLLRCNLLRVQNASVSGCSLRRMAL